MIENPILRGFNPDPSICRVGTDYYIATSTFQWFPGVQIHHSTDLVHWKLVAHPLNRISQLDMRGTPDSTGVWAPCLSYCDGLFYLIYSNVKNRFFSKDVTNYLVTAADVCGEWSEPIELNRNGFDPSLFHDDDGRKWLVNMKWDTQPGRNQFAGILLQEYSPAEKKLIGKLYNIFSGTPLKLTEGPHLYKRKGCYYLLTAEGGTGYDHAVTLARSRKITGPYEVHPQNPILTSKGTELQECLQKAGHASLVETNSGEWYLAHLCGRPVPSTKRCVLGRETALQKAEWRSDGWLWLCHNSNRPLTRIPAPVGCAPSPADTHNMDDHFDELTLNIHWNTLRIPASPRILSLNAKRGCLRLFGRDSLESLFEQSLVAHRQQSYYYTAETCMQFHPESSLHAAGLVCFYNTNNYYYLRMSLDETTQKFCLGVLASLNGDTSSSMPQDENLLFDTCERIYLKVSVAPRSLQFYYRFPENSEWQKIGLGYDSSTLSDDFAFSTDFEFTGAFVGLCCQDTLYGGHPCDFEFFKYQEQED